MPVEKKDNRYGDDILQALITVTWRRDFLAVSRDRKSTRLNSSRFDLVCRLLLEKKKAPHQRAGLQESLQCFAGQSDVGFTPHPWPAHCTRDVNALLAVAGDQYSQRHGQILRVGN